MIFFITGVGSGIGKATCLHVLENGHTVVGVLRNKAQEDLLEVDAKQFTGLLHLINADIGIEGFESSVQAQMDVLNIGVVDVLINVAGVLGQLSLNEFNYSGIQKIMQVNFIAPSLLIKLLLPYMKKSDQANIVNISSMSGFQGSVRFPGLSVYGASKAALSSLSETLSIELSPFNIHLNSLAIGAVNTQMLQSAFPDFSAEISPSQMAEYIYSFVTSGYRFYNGKTLPVAVTNP